jgi:hypothetical protein
LHIVINDKPVDALAPRVEKSLLLAKVHEQANGVIMTAADATDHYIRQTRKWFVILGSAGIVAMAAIMVAGISYEPRNAATFVIFGLAIGGTLGGFLWWLLGRRVRTWNAKLAGRAEGLPPPGTAVSFDANGLTLGAETFAWPSLSVDQVEITLSGTGSGDTSDTVAVVERLSLTAGARAFTLDRQMMQNGIVLVDNVWRRMRPKPA